MEQTIKPIEILLVEDSEGDARLAREALKESKIMNNVHHVMDGVEAMNFLHRKEKYLNAPRRIPLLLGCVFGPRGS